MRKAKKNPINDEHKFLINDAKKCYKFDAIVTFLVLIGLIVLAYDVTPNLVKVLIIVGVMVALTQLGKNAVKMNVAFNHLDRFEDTHKAEIEDAED